MSEHPKCFVHAKHRNCTGKMRWITVLDGVRLHVCERGEQAFLSGVAKRVNERMYRLGWDVKKP